MASCTKCGATLIARARFCATCGNPVAAGPGVPPTVSSEATTKPETTPETDPFAKTVLGDPAPLPPSLRPSQAQPAPQPPAISPMAASLMATPQPPLRPSQPPGRGPQLPPQTPAVPEPRVSQLPYGAPAGYIGTPWNVAPVAPPQGARPPPQGPTQYQPPANAASHPFAPGALVLVYWADGNRYPGTILQVSQHHVFVVFPNGTQQWVDVRYVTQGP
jgi:hypothetical protein